MKNIWELNSKFDYYLKVEIAVCEAYAELGEIPKEDVLKIKQLAKFDVKRIDEIQDDIAELSRSVDNSTEEILSALSASFENNTEITITATPAPGYKLSEISGIVGDTTWVGSTETTYKFNIIADTKLQARFVPEYTEIPEDLVGYGTICDDDGTPYIITGGQGGEEIVIDSLDDLTTYKEQIKNDDPYIIKIVGTITTVDNASVKFDVGSSKNFGLSKK